MSLTPDQVRAIYAKRRTKGQYSVWLHEFMVSGDSGISAREQWPTDLQAVGEDGKMRKATSIKQGFENAKGKKDAPDGSELVDVIVDGEDVFLINRAVYTVEEAEEATETATV